MILEGIIALFFICFGIVLLVGAPYLPTLKPQVRSALDLASLKPDETLLELGCGDGKILIAAAKRGYKAVGYELNPILALIAWLRTRRYSDQVQVIWGDFWHKPWPPAEAIFVFLLPKFMARLDAKIEADLPKPVRLVSFAFRVPGKPVANTQNHLYLYEYL